ncbi:MAG: hypothetical protein A2413_00360 [Treponema sp. RIFOXYC1_FULL_61_9]|nr:MAG: hypothetical protein A2001_16555 [Treponema sp. GWC1_61_84]OHE69777.1 MAG: hypothetical protein A2413_00360 [Treponema sp. RIFOXYC1_FULL_61_9]
MVNCFRAVQLGGAVPMARVPWNDTIWIQRTLDAAERAEEILAVEGVSGCFIGPNDLTLSMGLGLKDTGPGTRHEEAIRRTLEAAGKTGLPGSTVSVPQS